MSAKPFGEGVQHRMHVVIDRAAVNSESRSFEVAFSSDQPVERYWGVEILDHSPSAVKLDRLNAGGPLLWNHDRDLQIGVVERAKTDGKKCRATVRMGESARAKEIFADVLSGVIRNVSVGYAIGDMALESETEGVKTYRVKSWEPLEVSLVSIPADPTVGVGRDHDPNNQRAPDPTKTGNCKSMEPDKTPPQIDIAAERRNIRDAELSRINEINAIGKQFDVPALAERFIKEGKTVHEMNEATLTEIKERFAAKPPPTQVGMNKMETERYSLFNVLRVLADPSNMAFRKAAGLELEAHAAIEKQVGASSHGGIYVPFEVQSSRFTKHGKRDLTSGTDASGGYLVETSQLAGSFIDVLRNRMVIASLGARTLDGLVGDVTIPKLTAGGTAYWLSTEATAITESTQTTAQLALTPRTVGALTEVSRLLMLQSNPSAEQLVQDDLAKVLAIAIDKAALEGTGTEQPTGVANTGSIGSVTGTSIAYAGMLEFQTDVAGSNALAPGCAYVTTPSVAALLMQRHKASNTFSPLWEGGVLDGMACGFRGVSTLQVTAATMMFGDWSQVIIGSWGTIELAASPSHSTNFAAGITAIRAFATVDVGVRYAGAFSRATSIT